MMNRILYVGLLTGILSILGCSGQTKKAGDGLSNETKEQLAQSIDEFKNRPIYNVLTEQIIDTTPDNKLLQVVFDNLSVKQADNYEKEYETVMSWNKSRRAIYMIWILEAEINNGGYNQFYFNSSGEFYKQLPEALRLVGAKKFADLTQKANNIFEKEYKKITKHQDGTIEGFSKSYEDNPLNELDTKFYELYKLEDLQQIQVDYIRKHKKDFIDK